VSFDAIRWALSQPIPKSSTKFVLVAMADCVNVDGEQMVCWPSTKHLSDVTSQDRKTVLENIKRLRELGFIEQQKERRGMTGQVFVYELKTPKTGTVEADKTVPKTDLKSTENGTANCPEIGTVADVETVPILDMNSPDFGHEQSQKRTQRVPKTGHGTSKEPVKNQEGTSNKESRARPFDAGLIDLPQWLNRETWGRWVKDRKTRNKPITEDAARLQVKRLEEHLAAGFTPETVIDNAIENAWQGLYEPKNKPRTATRHAGFAGKNYREGASTDGSLI
jgi:hypothetical protein